MKNPSERLRIIIFIALLISINIILTRFLAVSVNQNMRFSFNFIPIVITAFVFGPWAAALMAMVSDVIGMFFSPFGIAGLSPGITICQGLIGLIFGFMFYKKRIFQSNGGSMLKKFSRISIAVLIQGILASYFLMSLTLAFMTVMASTKTGWFGILTNLFNKAYMAPVIELAKTQFTAYLAVNLFSRFIQNVIMIPIEIVVIFSMLHIVSPLKRIAGAKS